MSEEQFLQLLTVLLDIRTELRNFNGSTDYAKVCKSVTIGLTPTLILGSNANRRYGSIVCSSGATVWLATSQAACALNAGIPLSTSLGSNEFGKKIGPDYTGEWWGISTIASNVGVIEMSTVEELQPPLVQ